MSYKGGGPYNLIRHTKSMHPHVYVAIQEPNPPTSASAGPSSAIPTPTAGPSSAISAPIASESSTVPVHKTNAKLTQFITRPIGAKKTETINNLVVKMFAKNYLPLLLVESPDLKELVKELNPNYQLPTRKTLSNALMLNCYNKRKTEVKEKADKVSLTTDGWTSKPNDNLLISDGALF